MVLDMPLKYGSGLITLVNCFRILKLRMKTTKNCENGEFFVMPLKSISDLMGLVNRPRTLKLLAITHENG